MNFQIIKRTLGWILLFEAVFLLIPTLTGIVYQEKEVWDFLLSIVICLTAGGLLIAGKIKNDSIYAKEGYVIVALSWIVLSLFGALPFWISGAIPSYVDALFETVSGFTTTGATIIPTGEAVEALPKCLLMWRSFTHWIGGMGVLVFIMAFLPLSGARNMYLMKAESPGPTVGKLVPKVKQTAKILYLIYGALTLLQFLFLLCGGMPVFDAINTAFATAGTGGFSIKADGFSGYSPYLQVVVTVFMLIFSINFNSYYLALKGRWKEVFTSEVKTFLIIVASAIAFITANIYLAQAIPSFGDALRHAAFTVASIISTTGFATENFDVWPMFAQAILVLLMFIGACAGSTGGGIKVSRFILFGKSASNEVGKMLHPKQVKHVTVDGKVVEPEIVRAVFGYIVAYVLIFVLSFLIISCDLGNLNYSATNSGQFATGFTSVASTLNNIGPGLGVVGPIGSFADYAWWSKLVFIFDMLVGRLEVFPMLLLFMPATWRK